MKTNLKVTLAILAGIGIGTVAVQAIRGQEGKTAPAYVIAEIEKDPDKPQDPIVARKYRQGVPKTLMPFGGRVLVASPKAQAVEGEAAKGFIVVIAFDSLEKARGWYYSPAYEAIEPLRQSSTKSRILIIEGVTPE